MIRVVFLVCKRDDATHQLQHIGVTNVSLKPYQLERKWFAAPVSAMGFTSEPLCMSTARIHFSEEANIAHVTQ